MGDTYKKRLWTKDFIFTSVANLVLMLSMYLLLVTMATYAMDTYDATVSMGGFVSSIFIIGVLFGRLYGGKKIAVIGNRKMLLIGTVSVLVITALVSFAAGMLMLSQSGTGWVFLAAAVLMGLGYGNFQSIAQALAIKLTPHHRMGLANSTYFIALDLGLGLGPLMLGYIVPISGYRGMYLALVAVILAGIAVYHFMHGRSDREVAAGRNRV